MISRRDKNEDTFIAINMKLLGPRIEEKVVKVVERFRMVDRVFSFGMDAGSTERFKIANARFPVARSGNTKYHFETALRTTYLDYIWLTPMPPYLPSKEQFQTAEDRGKRVLIYIRQNEPKRWKAARAAGADAICTDYPIEAKRALGL